MTSLMINGARHAVATTIAPAVPVTDITNANPAIANTAAPPAVGTPVLLISGWPELNGSVAKVSAVAAGVSMTLGGVDTADVLRYPAGEGLGAFQAVSDFVNLTKVREVTQAGGEQNFYNYQYVDDASGRQQQAPTFKSAMSIAFQVDYDPTMPHFPVLVELDRKREIAVLRETLPNGDVLYYVGWISFNKVPTKVLNEFMANALTFSLTADPIRYAAA